MRIFFSSILISSLAASVAIAQNQYDGFMVFKPATSDELSSIRGVDQYGIDGAISLPDGRYAAPNSLGLDSTNPNNLQGIQQYYVPDKPALGLAISNNQGGDDTFICCWWYFPE